VPNRLSLLSGPPLFPPDSRPTLFLSHCPTKGMLRYFSPGLSPFCIFCVVIQTNLTFPLLIFFGHLFSFSFVFLLRQTSLPTLSYLAFSANLFPPWTYPAHPPRVPVSVAVFPTVFLHTVLLQFLPQKDIHPARPKPFRVRPVPTPTALIFEFRAVNLFKSIRRDLLFSVPRGAG